ncbi:MAG TPA: MFS transporter [Pseudolabrys sp.]|nr:MFS transporter [Pseudolabrys sp.]
MDGKRRFSTPVLLFVARALRGFGDGFAIVVLPAYLAMLGYNAAQIGLVAAAALLGTALFTLAVGFVAPRFDLKYLLIAGAMLMILTGLAFAQIEGIALLVAVAFFGTINPSTGDIGLLIPVEHAMLTYGATDENRTSIFARYSLIGAFSMAVGALAAAAPDGLVAVGATRAMAFKLMFYGYAALGIVCAAIYLCVPHAHAEQRPAAAPLRQSRGVVYRLAALFSLDAFAGGFVVQSLLVVWLFERFQMSLTTASIFFFWATALSAFSYPVAAWIARHIGLVNTMVFTHIPSSLCLVGAAFAPSLPVALAFLLVRAALSQMDVPTRSSYVMAVVTPPERPAAASVTAVPRSLASSLSPALAGELMTTAFLGLPLILCGVLKIVYDLALLFSFRNIKPPEEDA